MKRISAISILALASILAVGSAMAQDRGVQANVPFDFTVGNKTLPAGTYTVTRELPNTIMIQNKADHRMTAMAIAQNDTQGVEKGGRLIFNKYASQYFLSEVRCPYAAVNVDLPPSKFEKRAQSEEASVSRPDQVMVALNQ
jgi:hypothetical protein